MCYSFANSYISLSVPKPPLTRTCRLLHLVLIRPSTMEPAQIEAHVDDKAAEGEEEPAKSSANPPKSPTTMPTTEVPIPEAQTPGSGSGTKVDDSDVLITGSRQGPVHDPSVLVLAPLTLSLAQQRKARMQLLSLLCRL